MTEALLAATVSSAVQPLKTELRWQRWMLFALVAAVFSPKLGGPSAPQVTAFTADPNVGPHLLALARFYLGH